MHVTLSMLPRLDYRLVCSRFDGGGCGSVYSVFSIGIGNFPSLLPSFAELSTPESVGVLGRPAE